MAPRVILKHLQARGTPRPTVHRFETAKMEQRTPGANGFPLADFNRRKAFRQDLERTATNSTSGR
jgi:hypothetical protein